MGATTVTGKGSGYYVGRYVGHDIRFIEDHLEKLMRWSSIPDILDAWHAKGRLSKLQLSLVERAAQKIVAEQEVERLRNENERKAEVERKKNLIRKRNKRRKGLKLPCR